MQPQNLFVNYTHPDQQGDRQQRQRVASYIGTYYRNRSRPQARRKNELNFVRIDMSKPANKHTRDEERQTSAMQVPNQGLGLQTASLLVIHDTHGFRVDPFNSYPIPYTKNLPQALDYC